MVSIDQAGPSCPTCLSQLFNWGWHEGTRYIVHVLQWKQGRIHIGVIRTQGPGLVTGGRVKGNEDGHCRMCRSSPGKRCRHSKI